MRPLLTVATVVSPHHQPTATLIAELANADISVDVHEDGASSLLAIGRALPDLVVVPEGNS